VVGNGLELADLVGLEVVRALESLILFDGRLQRLDGIEGLGGLRRLSFWRTASRTSARARSQPAPVARAAPEPDRGHRPADPARRAGGATLSSNRINRIPSLSGMVSLRALHLNNYLNGADEELTHNPS